MKQFFTLIFSIKKSFRFLILLLILLVALPIIETTQAEAQTSKTGNFFTRRFKRTHKFNRKSKNSTAFQRKPFSCEDIGKIKVEQAKVSKKQLRHWEEERLVQAQQEELKEQRQAKAQTKSTNTENIAISASSKNDMEEFATKKSITKLETAPTTLPIAQKIEDQKERGWYSSAEADAPKISPILFNSKNEIISQNNKQELEIAAKHARLGYSIILQSANQKQVEAVKNYLISIGTEKEAIKVNSSSTENQNEVSIKIEK